MALEPSAIPWAVLQALLWLGVQIAALRLWSARAVWAALAAQAAASLAFWAALAGMPVPPERAGAAGLAALWAGTAALALVFNAASALALTRKR